MSNSTEMRRLMLLLETPDQVEAKRLDELFGIGTRYRGWRSGRQHRGSLVDAFRFYKAKYRRDDSPDDLKTFLKAYTDLNDSEVEDIVDRHTVGLGGGWVNTHMLKDIADEIQHTQDMKAARARRRQPSDPGPAPTGGGAAPSHTPPPSPAPAGPVRPAPTPPSAVNPAPASANPAPPSAGPPSPAPASIPPGSGAPRRPRRSNSGSAGEAPLTRRLTQGVEDILTDNQWDPALVRRIVDTLNNNADDR